MSYFSLSTNRAIHYCFNGCWIFHCREKPKLIEPIFCCWTFRLIWVLCYYKSTDWMNILTVKIVCIRNYFLWIKLLAMELLGLMMHPFKALWHTLTVWLLLLTPKETSPLPSRHSWVLPFFFLFCPSEGQGGGTLSTVWGRGSCGSLLFLSIKLPDMDLSLGHGSDHNSKYPSRNMLLGLERPATSFFSALGSRRMRSFCS